MKKASDNEELPGKTLLIVGRIPIIESPAENKCNPNSLRVLFGAIINIFFDGEIKSAAKKLSEYGGIYKSNRQQKQYRALNVKAVTGILKDKDFVAYWHLESIARFLSCPTGAVLLMSRFFSANDPGHKEERDALIKGVRALADLMEEITPGTTVTKEHIEVLQVCFSEFQRFEDERKKQQCAGRDQGQQQGMARSPLKSGAK